MEKNHFSGCFLSNDDNLILFFSKLETEPVSALINQEKIKVDFIVREFCLNLKENKLHHYYARLSQEKTIYVVEIDFLGIIKKEYEIPINKC